MAAGAAAIAALALLSIAYGSTVIPVSEVIAALAGALGLEGGDVSGPVGRIVVDLRLPRTLLAISVGAGLGIVGALLQTVTRNDLADPFLFGLSSGAAAGAVSVITIFGDRFGVWTLPAAAFTGGILAAGVVLLLVSRVRGQGPERLILAGLDVSFLFIALTNYMVFAGDQRAAHSVLFWTMGGLGLARWDNILLAATGSLTILAFALYNNRKLDALLAGGRLRRVRRGADPGQRRSRKDHAAAAGIADRHRHQLDRCTLRGGHAAAPRKLTGLRFAISLQCNMYAAAQYHGEAS
jgi:iron complex transport system permease protein